MTIPELVIQARETQNVTWLISELGIACQGLSEDAINESPDVEEIVKRINFLSDQVGLADMQLREATAEYQQYNKLFIE